MLRTRPSESVAEALEWACRLDVLAMKPGNVSVASPGHGMRAEDFLASAEAIVEPMSAPGLKVGQRIAEAVEATWSRVGMNTNLGIVLLAAPLVHAALSAEPGESLQTATRRALATLDADDAAQVFRAIARANPAGLGEVDRFDVHESAPANLLEAMREAAHRDTIARQYVNGFRDVFEFGVPRFCAASERSASDERATVACFVAWLARFPDSHIARKHGPEVARAVSREALVVEAKCIEEENAAGGDALLREWDASLKARGVNPGTSADLTVASLLSARLDPLSGTKFSGRDESSIPSRKGMWMPLAAAR